MFLNDTNKASAELMDRWVCWYRCGCRSGGGAACMHAAGRSTGSPTGTSQPHLPSVLFAHGQPARTPVPPFRMRLATTYFRSSHLRCGPGRLDSHSTTGSWTGAARATWRAPAACAACRCPSAGRRRARWCCMRRCPTSWTLCLWACCRRSRRNWGRCVLDECVGGGGVPCIPERM